MPPVGRTAGKLRHVSDERLVVLAQVGDDPVPDHAQCPSPRAAALPLPSPELMTLLERRNLLDRDLCQRIRMDDNRATGVDVDYH